MPNFCACTASARGPPDIFLLFCLGHPDAWPAGDLAQEAARMALEPAQAAGYETAREDRRTLASASRRRGLRWWAYYRVMKDGRAGMALA